MTYAHGTRLFDAAARQPRRYPPCPDCDTSTLPQTALEAIRRYEHIGRIPWSERLDVQPCEQTQGAS